MRVTSRAVIYLCTVLLGWINTPAQAFFSSNDQDLWSLISDRFSLSHQADRSEVQHQIDLAMKNPEYIQHLSENAQPYLYYVFQETEKLNLPAEIALVPMIESEYTLNDASHAGAAGLWQLMPGTAHSSGIKIDHWYDGRRTPMSTKAALSFLSYLYEQFDHKWLLALAAYDAGPGTVTAAIRHNKRAGKPTDFWSLSLPKETRAYVPRLLALATIVEHSKSYGVHLAPVPNKPMISTVTVEKQMPIAKIASLANASVKEIKKLNPALRQGMTPPHRAVSIVLPIKNKTIFEDNLNQQIASKGALENISVETYFIKAGDTLGEIAKRYHLTVEHLMSLNHLREHQLSQLKIGRKLLLN